MFDFDASWSLSRFTTFDPVGKYIPERVGTVVSGGASIENLHKWDGAARWRYFGPRTLDADNAEQSHGVVPDIHTHPTIPRTARLSFHVGF